MRQLWFYQVHLWAKLSSLLQVITLVSIQTRLRHCPRLWTNWIWLLLLVIARRRHLLDSFTLSSIFVSMRSKLRYHGCIEVESVLSIACSQGWLYICVNDCVALVFGVINELIVLVCLYVVWLPTMMLHSLCYLALSAILERLSVPIALVSIDNRLSIVIIHYLISIVFISLILLLMLLCRFGEMRYLGSMVWRKTACLMRHYNLVLATLKASHSSAM